MSVANLLYPNNDELYIGTLHVDNLITGVTGATGPAGDIFTNNIDTPSDVGPASVLNIGQNNAGSIIIGNPDVQINLDAFILELPGITGAAYQFGDSRVEQVLIMPATGAYIENIIVSIRRIGNWVDMHLFQGNPANVTVATSEQGPAGFIPVGYRPLTSQTYACLLNINLLPANNIGGFLNITSGGQIAFAPLSAAFTIGTTAQLNAFSVSYLII